jgi:hypothetical protein
LYILIAEKNTLGNTKRGKSSVFKIYTDTHTHTHTHIYIYKKRERAELGYDVIEVTE